MAETLTRKSTRWLSGREYAVALVLTVVWFVAMGAYAAGYFGLFGSLAVPRSAAFLEVVLFLLAIYLPIVLFWIAAVLMRNTTDIEREAKELSAQVRRLEGEIAAHEGSRQTASDDRTAFELRNRLENLSGQMQQMESAMANIIAQQADSKETLPDVIAEKISKATQPIRNRETGPSSATTQTAKPTNIDQGNLPLGTSADQLPYRPPAWEDLIMALNFPKNPEDRDGFRAMTIAMRHRTTALCLRAAEDVLNLFAEEGIYTEDIKPEIAPASLWREFARGKRGPDIEPLGGIRDHTAISLTKARMRNDTVFRDTALHFQRRFDAVLREFADEADDSAIEALADTRSGRAFMILGRVIGTFAN